MTLARTPYARLSPADIGQVDRELKKLEQMSAGLYVPKVLVAARSPYTVQGTDTMLLVDCTAGPVTLTFPLAARVEGMSVVVVKSDTTTNAITLSGTFSGAVNPQITVSHAGYTVSAMNGVYHVTGSVTYPVLTGETGVANMLYPYRDVRRFGAINGADIASAVQRAHDSLPSSGGIIDVSNIVTGGIGTGISLTKPTRIVLGNAALVATVPTMFTVGAPTVVVGATRTACSLTPASGGILFSGTSVVPYFRIARVLLQGNGLGSQALVTPSFTGPVSWAEGRVTVEDCIAQDWGAYALQFGQSTYMIDVRRVRFVRNRGSIDNRWASDGNINDNEFWLPVANAQLKTIGGSQVNITKNSFLLNNAASTDPDVEINCDGTSGQAGWVKINGNKFGGEGDIAGRYKIRNYYSGSATASSWNVEIIGNTFIGGVPAQKAILLSNPIAKWVISNNDWSNFSTLIDDTFTNIGLDVGGSVFDKSNVIYDIGTTNPTTPIKLFTNGGRGFSVIEPPQKDAIQVRVGQGYVPSEAPELRNRLGFSEALGSWTLNNVTVLSGQADPWGTTRAFKLTAAGITGSESIAQALSVTGGGTNALFLKFWATSNTLTTLQLALLTGGVVQGALPIIQLDSQWRQFCVPFTGLTVSSVHTIQIYPGNAINVTPGSIFIAAPHVDDYDGDYYPTTGAAASDPAYGARYERAVWQYGGVQVGATGTKITQVQEYAPNLSPVTIAASAAPQEQTFTVSGLQTTDSIFLGSVPAMTNGVWLVRARASATNTLALSWVNSNAGAATPAVGTYSLLAIRS